MRYENLSSIRDTNMQDKNMTQAGLIYGWHKIRKKEDIWIFFDVIKRQNYHHEGVTLASSQLSPKLSFSTLFRSLPYLSSEHDERWLQNTWNQSEFTYKVLYGWISSCRLLSVCALRVSITTWYGELLFGRISEETQYLRYTTSTEHRTSRCFATSQAFGLEFDLVRIRSEEVS